MRLTSFFHPQDLMRKPGFDDYNSGFPRLQIVCQNLTESDNSNPVLYSNETLSRKLFLPGVFVFPEEKPPYIARLLYETVTGLFHFCRLCRTIMKKEDYSMEKETIAAEAVSSGRTGKPDALSRRRTAITWPSLRKRTRLAKAAAMLPVSASA